MAQRSGRIRRPRLFTVRIWSEAMGDRLEHRGTVRAVDTGAFRGFREWTDLADFLTEQLEDNDR